MSEVGGVAQQLRGAQAVAQNGQQQQQVREDREEREAERSERRNAIREERDARTERQSAQSRTAAASAQQVENEERRTSGAAARADREEQAPSTQQQEGRGEIVDTMAGETSAALVLPGSLPQPPTTWRINPNSVSSSQWRDAVSFCDQELPP